MEVTVPLGLVLQRGFSEPRAGVWCLGRGQQQLPMVVINALVCKMRGRRYFTNCLPGFRPSVKGGNSTYVLWPVALQGCGDTETKMTERSALGASTSGEARRSEAVGCGTSPWSRDQCAHRPLGLVPVNILINDPVKVGQLADFTGVTKDAKTTQLKKSSCEQGLAKACGWLRVRPSAASVLRQALFVCNSINGPNGFMK